MATITRKSTAMTWRNLFWRGMSDYVEGVNRSVAMSVVDCIAAQVLVPAHLTPPVYWEPRFDGPEQPNEPVVSDGQLIVFEKRHSANGGATEPLGGRRR